MPFNTSAMCGTMDKIDARIPCVLHSISHLLYALLAVGSAMCDMKNSMFITPVSAHVARAIVARAGVGITRNFRVVWKHANLSTRVVSY